MKCVYDSEKSGRQSYLFRPYSLFYSQRAWYVNGHSEQRNDERTLKLNRLHEAKATEVLRVCQDIRGGVPKAIIVLSMVGKNYRLTHDMKDAAAALDLPLASRPIILRQIYADAPGQGSVVWNMGSRAKDATEEIDVIFREILPEAAKPRPPTTPRRKR